MSKKPNPFTSEQIYQAFDKCQDVKILQVEFGSNDPIQLLFVYADEMCNQDEFNKLIIPDLEKIFDNAPTKTWTADTLIQKWSKPTLGKVLDVDTLITKVFDGDLIFYFDKVNTVYSVTIPSKPQRKPEETNAEITIRGPRDGFIEELSVNVALIRKRLRTNSLKYEQFIVGKRSQTKVALMYIGDIILIPISGLE